MDSKEFDKIMTKPYSKDGWAVLPLAKPSIDKNIDDFLKETRYKLVTTYLIEADKK